MQRPLVASGSGSKFSLGDELQHVDVESLIGDDALELGVLLVEFRQPLRVVRLHTAVLILPAVLGRLVDLEVSIDHGDDLAVVEQLRALGKLPDHPFGCVTPLFHAVLLIPSWSIGTRIARGSAKRDLSITSNSSFENWTEVPGSERLTGATMDRLTNRWKIIETKGESYRLQDAAKRSRTSKS